MSSIHAYADKAFPQNSSFVTNRVVKHRYIALDQDVCGSGSSIVPVSKMLVYLLTLVSTAVLILTGQPPWFLLTTVVAMLLIFFLPGRLDTTLRK